MPDWWRGQILQPLGVGADWTTVNCDYVLLPELSLCHIDSIHLLDLLPLLVPLPWWFFL